MTILLDGAMGTELERRGARMDAPLWSAHALVEQPDCIRNIHLEYLQAGAQVLTTNSFRTHARNLAAAGPEMAAQADLLTRRSVELAHQARAQYRQQVGEVPIRIAGAISPLGDCFEPEHSPGYAEALAPHRDIAGSLAAAGCDLFLIETMAKIDEATAAVRAASAFDLPIWLAVVCGPTGDLLGGETLAELGEACRGLPLQALLINCTDTQYLGRALPALAQATREGPARGLYPHTGQSGGAAFVTHAGDAAWFAETIASCVAEDPGLQIVGSCCGSTPAWTAELAHHLHPTTDARMQGFAELKTLA